jgi:hypothetical protein
VSQTLKTAIAVVGIDIGKNSFHVVGLDQRGAIVLRQKWSPSGAAAVVARARRNKPSKSTFKLASLIVQSADVVLSRACSPTQYIAIWPTPQLWWNLFEPTTYSCHSGR